MKYFYSTCQKKSPYNHSITRLTFHWNFVLHVCLTCLPHKLWPDWSGNKKKELFNKKMLNVFQLWKVCCEPATTVFYKCGHFPCTLHPITSHRITCKTCWGIRNKQQVWKEPFSRNEDQFSRCYLTVSTTTWQRHCYFVNMFLLISELHYILFSLNFLALFLPPHMTTGLLFLC